jgi:hypothetical protein
VSMRLVTFALAWLPLTALAQQRDAPAAPQPRYLAAMRSELDSMGISATCEAESPTRAGCVYQGRTSLTERGLEVHAEYSDETDTIYFYVAQLLRAPVGAASTSALLARLMELNWELLGCKLEWNPRTGEVRLSAVMHTDSNFDRRTFRSIVVALDTTTARYRAELAHLAAQLSERTVDHAPAAEVGNEAPRHVP